MNTHTLNDADDARTERTCSPCHGCPAVTRLNDVIDNLLAALATATGRDVAVARLSHLGQVSK